MVGPSPEIRKSKKYVMIKKGYMAIYLMIPDDVENIKNNHENKLGYTHAF